MKITCPDCGFSREVLDDKIPSSARRATCPKCGVKFTFRRPEPDFILDDGESSESEPTSSAPETTSGWKNPYDPDPREQAAAPQDDTAGAGYEDETAEEAGYESAYERYLRKKQDLEEQEQNEPAHGAPVDLLDDAVRDGEETSEVRDEPLSASEEARDEISQEDDTLHKTRENGFSKITQGLDPLDHEAEERPQPRQPRAAQDDSQAGKPADGNPAKGNPGDIWQKLESMDMPGDDAETPPWQNNASGRDAADGQPGDRAAGRADERNQKRDAGRRAQAARSYAAGAEDTPVVDVPWEHLNSFGFFNGLFQTIKRVMFSPWLFFETMPVRGGMLRPLIFYMLIYLFETLCQYAWGITGFSTASLFSGPDMMGEETFLPANMEAQLLLFVYPLIFAGLLFVGAGINHLFLLAVQSGKAGFEGTFRALAYSSAPMVVSFIPVVGPLIGAVWSFVITFIAFKNVHKTTFVRVIIAFLLPLVILVAMSLLVAVGANHSV